MIFITTKAGARQARHVSLRESPVAMPAKIRLPQPMLLPVMRMIGQAMIERAERKKRQTKYKTLR